MKEIKVLVPTCASTTYIKFTYMAISSSIVISYVIINAPMCHAGMPGFNPTRDRGTTGAEGAACSDASNAS